MGGKACAIRQRYRTGEGQPVNGVGPMQHGHVRHVD